MALLCDGNVSTPLDLRKHDSSILDLASEEGVDLTAKIELARKDLEVEATAFLDRNAPGTPVTEVVITDAIRNWHALHTLALVYRDIYHNQLNDRFRGRYEEYSRLSERAAGRVYEIGLGVVADPIRRAEIPDVSSIPGESQSSATYYVQISWVNSAGTEGETSPVTTYTVQAGHQMTVAARTPPPNATKWNVYVGETADGLQRQNASSMPAGTTWTMPASGVVAGPKPAEGQSPERFIRETRILQRG